MCLYMCVSNEVEHGVCVMCVTGIEKWLLSLALVFS